VPPNHPPFDPHADPSREAERNEPGRGRGARTPSEIPRAGWRDILLRVGHKFGEDNISLIASGVTLNTVLAVFPAMAVLASVYGMFASPAEVAKEISPFYGILPHDVASIIQTQLQALARPRNQTLGIGAIVSFIVTIYYASQGVSALMSATNIAYTERERRGFLQLILVAAAFAMGAVVGFVLMLLLTIAVPLALKHFPLPHLMDRVALALRWVLLWVFAALGLAIVYRYAPSRQNAQWRWVSWGSVIAATLCLASSFLFSLYVRDFGSYGRTYGALGGVIVLIMWFYLQSFAIVIGAEVNAEMEHQTAVDTTDGPPAPMGKRGAYVADTLGKRPK
jgi:membrane protein